MAIFTSVDLDLLILLESSEGLEVRILSIDHGIWLLDEATLPVSFFLSAAVHVQELTCDGELVVELLPLACFLIGEEETLRGIVHIEASVEV